MTTTVIKPNLDVPSLIYSDWSTAQIVTNDAIANTAGHDPTNDTAFSLCDCRSFPGAKVVFVNNGCNQQASVNIVASYDGVNVFSLGTSQTVNANFSGWIDPNNVSALAWPYPYVGVKVSYSVAPTGGGLLNVYLSMRSV